MPKGGLNNQKMVQKIKQLDILTNSERSIKSIDKIKKTLEEILDYKYDISEFQNQLFSTKNIEERLGQVKTPTWIAELISNLCIKNAEDKILDPCYGEGIFLLSAFKKIKKLDKSTKPNLWGVEIDPIYFVEGLRNILTINENADKLNNSFFCGSIFDFNEQLFDCIILNPPYIRQENLSNVQTCGINKKEIHKKISKIWGLKLSLRSNLYIYFIVYLTHLLKNNGKMGIIMPKVWMDSQHGVEFQKFLLENFEIEFIIDFAKDTFDKVIVEDCVLILKKETKSSSKIPFLHVKKKLESEELKQIKQKKSFKNENMSISFVKKEILEKDHKWGKYLEISSDILKSLQGKNLTNLSNLAKIHRGIETNWNEFFIVSEKNVNKFKIQKNELKKIISSPKKIKMLNTSYQIDFDYLLDTNKEIQKRLENSGSSKYIDEYQKIILKNEKQSLIKKMVKKNPETWYIIKEYNPAPIIFGYIIRKSKFFFRNSENYLARDNFYNILPKKEDTEIMFAILNSSLVRLQLELIGRRYGNGVLKIQTYELKDLQIPNIQNMSEKTKKEIISLSKKLSELSILEAKDSQIIRKIDKIIEKFCELEISVKDINKFEREMVESRLSRGK